MSKAARLEIAGIIAPVLRGTTEATKSRRVTLYNKETGEVTGHTDGATALRGLARLQELEHAVVDDVRPASVICRSCGKTVSVSENAGRIPTICQGGCRRRCETPGCENTVALSTARRRARDGGAIRCRGCASRATHDAETEERRASRMAKAIQAVKRMHDAMTPKQRAERNRKLVAKMTAEQLSERARKGAATRNRRRASP